MRLESEGQIRSLSAAECADELIYINYKINRKLRPDIPANQWERLYGERAIEMEQRYQKETTNAGTK